MIHRKTQMALVAFALFISKASAAPRLYLDSRPTNLDPKNPICRLIFRELPRQALIVAATQELGATCFDPTVEPDAKPDPGDVKLGLDYKIDPARLVQVVKLYGPSDQLIDTAEISQRVNEQNIVAYDEFASSCEELVRTKWETVVAKQLSVTPKTPIWNASLAAPDQCDRLLATIDFQHAFLAARLTHQSIAESGESPARLGALVRAYAHLGDATHHLVAGQSIGFFARSLMYAQRLVHLAPDDPSSWQYRAYAEALCGIPIAADADLKRADTLGGKSQAAWVGLTRDLIAYRTSDLFAKSRGTDPLASYFAFLTVEHAPLPSLPINFGRVALDKNPGAIRIIDSLSANSTVILNHQTTVQAAPALYRLISTLAGEAAAPQTVQAAAQAALDARFSIPSILTLLKTLDVQPLEPGQPLQWSTYVSLVRECEFVDCVRRLDFMAHMWGVDPSAERQQWLLLLNDHRYAAFIRSFANPTQLPDPEVVAKVRAIDFKDDTLSANLMVTQLRSLGIEMDPRRNLHWTARQREQSGNTAYDLAQAIWLYRFTSIEGNESQRNYLRNEARTLASLATNHPIANLVLLTTDWATLQPQALQLERDMGGNPIVAYALGRAYAQAGRSDDAIRLLESAARYAPDKEVYEPLAAIRLAENDETGWLKTWEKYLATSEDFRLDHGIVNKEIADHFIGKEDFQAALPYAKNAADTGATWGFTQYAHVLLMLHQYDLAAQVFQADAERYNTPGTFYRYCRTTGHGNLAVARAIYQQNLNDLEKSGDPAIIRDTGLYYYLEGNSDKAAELWQRNLDLEGDHFNSLLLSILLIDQNKPDRAKTILESASKLPAETLRVKIYAACVAETLRCLSDQSAVPARDGELSKLMASKEAGVQRGNVCYFLGRLCELRQRNDDAKWWYRASLDVPYQYFTCRPLAAVSLRRLGEEYYK